MLRTKVFKLAADDHVLLVITHHIASDGWSVGVFCRDLSELYDARRTQRPPQLPELQMQFRDFVHWQRSRLSGDRLERERDHWRGRLAGAPTVMQLPTDRPRPSRQTFDGASLPVTLPRDVAEDVLLLCRDTRATPYMLLLSVFGLLLYRLTGQDDILVGGPFANRSRSEFDHLVGFFANTLVLRVRLAGNPPFTELLDRVGNTVLDALDHQEFPFDQVVEAVRPARQVGINPLVQVNFRVGVEPPPTLELEGASTAAVPLDHGFAAFDLALDLRVLDEGIVGEFIYDTDLFDRTSVERFAADFDGLLRQVLEQPDSRLLALELASDGRAAEAGSSGPRAAIRRVRATNGSSPGEAEAVSSDSDR
jgi:hypothetical protein